ncbi:MAG: peptidase [Pirellulaceae bacterium]|jgi:hypothetical protein|nr:peptidase [Pirellulaceae bacterium]
MDSANVFANRRKFISQTAAAAICGSVSSIAVANVHTASKTDREIILGQGDFQYRVDHDIVELPQRYSWQTTHNVAVDRENNLYVIHEGRVNQKDHPSIFVFDSKGKFKKAFGARFQGGGHGIEVRQEGNEEYLYVCGYQQVKSFEKLSLEGERVWKKNAPMDSGLYAEGEDTNPQKIWGRNRFLPTNFAFLENGEFLLADGYGSFFIHHFDKDANWIRHFGGPGKGEGKFNTPHGIWIDNRKKDQPEIVICDRAHHNLQFLDMNGGYLRTKTGFGLPANVDTFEDLMLIPELHARLTILDGENRVVAQLGDDVKRITSEGGIRNDAKKWRSGKFVHPHDACFDSKGDIFVAEWVQSGRVSKLTRV